jgi:hypothetical protein
VGDHPGLAGALRREAPEVDLSSLRPETNSVLEPGWAASAEVKSERESPELDRRLSAVCRPTDLGTAPVSRHLVGYAILLGQIESYVSGRIEDRERRIHRPSGLPTGSVNGER